MRLLILLPLFLLSAFQQTKTCTCVKPADEETTYWSNGEVTMKDDKIYKGLHGVVQYSAGKPMPGALVEIYDKPENVLRSREGLNQKPIRQHRIAACKTGIDGSFCFVNIPSGKYELRVSKSPETCCAWNPVRAYVIINSRNRNSTNVGLKIEMQVSL